MASQVISRQLARFAHNSSFQDLPNEVIGRAKCLILDALGTAVAGRDLLYPKLAFRTVEKNRGNATVFTYGTRLPPMDATFVNAIMVSSIGQDDMMYSFHPGAVVIPAALAISEERNPIGPEVITAVVVGYEIMARTFLAAPHITPRFRGVTVFGPLGAAAACGRLLKLSEDQLANALGYAANLSSGFAECWIAGTMEGKFHNGLASRNGIMAGLLAEQGATAAETSFEGKAGFYQAFAGSAPDLSKLTSGLGSNFAIMEAEYKVFPVCALEQIPVNLALGLVEMNNIDPKTIANVTVVMPEAEYLYPGTNNPGPFTSRFQAIMSSQFCVAAALLGKPVRSHTFYDNGYADPEVTGLAHKIILVGEKGKNEISIEVALHDGSRFSAQGGKEDLLVPDFAKIRTKFENLAIEYLGTEGVDRVVHIVSDLDKIGDIGELTRHLSHT